MLGFLVLQVLANVGLLGRFAALIIFCYIIITSIIFTLSMTFLSQVHTTAIARAASKEDATLRPVIAGALHNPARIVVDAIDFSALRHISSLWTFRTELPIRHLIRSHELLFGIDRQKAEGRVYRKMSFWMYLLNGATGFDDRSHHLQGLWNLTLSASVATLVFYTASGYNSGWVLLYTLFTFMIFASIRDTLSLYVRSLYSMMLTINFNPIINNAEGTSPLQVHQGLIQGDYRTVTVFDHPVEPVSTIHMLAEHYGTDNNSAKIPEIIDASDSRVAYVKKNLTQGYPEEILRQALLDAGNTPQTVDQIFEYASTSKA